jgi:hypothetical protein
MSIVVDGVRKTMMLCSMVVIARNRDWQKYQCEHTMNLFMENENYVLI